MKLNAEFAGDILGGIDKKAAEDDISGFFEGLDLPSVLKEFEKTFEIVGDLAWEAISLGLKGIGLKILKFIWEDIGEHGSEKLSKDSDAWDEIYENFIGGLKEAFDKKGKEETSLFDSFFTAFKLSWNSLITTISDWLKQYSLTKWLGNILDDFTFDLSGNGEKSAKSFA